MERELARAGVGTREQGLLEFYLKHRSALIDYAARITGSSAWAEDIVQDAYLRIIVSESQDRGDHAKGNPRQIVHPVAYLYRIVRNLALDWMRHLLIEEIDQRDNEAIDLVAASQTSPEYEFLYREEARLAAVALAELPQRMQVAFEMYCLDGCTLREIAQRLEISVTLTHQLVRRAAAHCKERLGQPDFE
jgi:RNA polymerase sigma factor (sigma-70 family)